MASNYSHFIVCHMPKSLKKKLEGEIFACDGNPEDPASWRTDDSWDHWDGKFLRIARAIIAEWPSLSTGERSDCLCYFLESYCEAIVDQMLSERMDRETFRKEFPLGPEGRKRYAGLLVSDPAYAFLKANCADSLAECMG